MLPIYWIVTLSLFTAGPPRPTLRPTEAFCQYSADGRSIYVMDGFCVSSDGKRLALDCWEVWDLPSRKFLFKGRVHGAHARAFSPDGKFLAVGGNYSEFFVHHASDGKLHWNLTLAGHGDTVITHIEFTPDGRMVSASANGILRVWDVPKREAVAMFCFSNMTWHDKASQEEYQRVRRALAVKGKLPYDAKTVVVSPSREVHLHQFSLSPDGKSVAVPTRSADVLLIELATGKIVKTLATDQKPNCAVKFSPDGKTLAVGATESVWDEGGWTGTVELWDVTAARRVRALRGHARAVMQMAFSPDGKILATGGMTDGVRVWDTVTGRLMYRLHKEQETANSLGMTMRDIAFLPDGKALLTLPETSIHDPQPVHFWEPATGKRIPQPLGK